MVPDVSEQMWSCCLLPKEGTSSLSVEAEGFIQLHWESSEPPALAQIQQVVIQCLLDYDLQDRAVHLVRG